VAFFDFTLPAVTVREVRGGLSSVLKKLDKLVNADSFLVRTENAVDGVRAPRSASGSTRLPRTLEPATADGGPGHAAQGDLVLQAVDTLHGVPDFDVRDPQEVAVVSDRRGSGPDGGEPRQGGHNPVGGEPALGGEYVVTGLLEPPVPGREVEVGEGLDRQLDRGARPARALGRPDYEETQKVSRSRTDFPE
jgi:hypothetical protein